MSRRYHPYFFARDYEKCVVAKGKCLLEAPPEDYKPLFTIVDFSSLGFRTMSYSWIVDRPIHYMSNPESDAGLVFHEPALKVRNLSEQFALDPALTREAAFELGVDHPAIRHLGTMTDIIMSTDLVVTFERPGGMLERHAFAVKRAKDLTERIVEKLAIEQAYWAKRNIPWSLLLDTHLPRRLVENMQLVIDFADEDQLPCDTDMLPAMAAWLISGLHTGATLRTVCSRCDDAMALLPGTALSVAYHLTLKGILPLDLRGDLLYRQTLQSLQEAA
jgi:hypothetical protein